MFHDVRNKADRTLLLEEARAWQIVPSKGWHDVAEFTFAANSAR